MKKIGLKVMALLILLSSYFFLKPIQGILDYPLNQMLIARSVAGHLFDEEEAVSSTPVVVIDYIIKEDELYVFPIDGKIVLPMDSMVCSVKRDSIEIVANDIRYEIAHFEHMNAKLYQYIHAKNELGTTNDFYVIYGEKVEEIAKRFTIYYEKV